MQAVLSGLSRGGFEVGLPGFEVGMPGFEAGLPGFAVGLPGFEAGLLGFPLKKERFLSTKLVLQNTIKFKLSDISITLMLTFALSNSCSSCFPYSSNSSHVQQKPTYRQIKNVNSKINQKKRKACGKT